MTKVILSLTDAIKYVAQCSGAHERAKRARRAIQLADQRLGVIAGLEADKHRLENALHAAKLDAQSHFEDASKWRFKEAIPMILHCPECRARHVDAGEFAIKKHHTHACQGCGFVWRPAVWNTVGVRFLPGFKDGEESK